GNHDVFARAALPIKHARLGFVADDKWKLFINSVLFSMIDLHSRVISRRSKRVTLFQVRGVKIGPRIDYERNAAGRNFDAQCVVVSVRAAALDAAVARIEE